MKVTPYRFSIAAGLEAYRPELEYACDFLDRCYLLQRQAAAERVLHYGPGAPAGAIAVPAALFPAGTRLDGEGIHLDRGAFADIEAGRGKARLLPPGNAPGNAPGSAPGSAKDAASAGRLGYDAMGLIFLMLSRLEERGSPRLDEYGRFPHAAALAARAGREAEPLADRAAHDVAAALLGIEAPASRTRYQVELTHDVDMLRGYHRLLQPARNALGDIVKRRRPRAAGRRLRDAYLGGEPWRSVRDLMALSERVGLTSRFFFMGPSRLSNDSPYAATMTGLLRRVADEIRRRGHVIGFHPGFATAADPDEWRRQKLGLEAILGHAVAEGRQHVLQYVADRTPDIWAEGGMERDYTLGFPEAVGFRNGTCRGHRAYSLRQRRALELEQIATPIMDFGLFGGKYRDLTVDQALAEGQVAADACRAYGGRFVVLYHTGQSRGPVREFYQRLVEAVV